MRVGRFHSVFPFSSVVLTKWKWIVKLVKATGSLAHAMNHLALSIFIHMVKTVFLLLLTNATHKHIVALKWKHCSRTTSRNKYSVNTMQLNSTQHWIRLFALVPCEQRILMETPSGLRVYLVTSLCFSCLRCFSCSRQVFFLRLVVLRWMETMLYIGHKMAQTALMEGFPMNHCCVNLHWPS